MRGLLKQPELRACVECGEEFWTDVPNRKRCNNHSSAHHRLVYTKNCEGCGQYIEFQNKTQRFCKPCRAERVSRSKRRYDNGDREKWEATNCGLCMDCLRIIPLHQLNSRHVCRECATKRKPRQARTMAEAERMRRNTR